ncbi:MAG: glycosyltransferase [Acidimicrobiales bacterium]
MTRTVVIPMLNEAARIEATLEALANSPLRTAAIILVDDGSADDTTQIARAAIAANGLSGQVIELGRNMGKGAAVRTGITAASGDAIAFSDADLSSPVEEIVKCLDLIESGTADMVCATRLSDESVIHVTQTITRRWSGKAFNVLLRMLGLTHRADTQCGLKAFNEKAAGIVFRDLRIKRFAFDVELLLRAERAGLRIVELPVSWSHDDRSRVQPVRDGARMALDVIRLRWILRADDLTGDNKDPTAMNDVQFETMARVEHDHWWFKAKRELVADLVRRTEKIGIKLPKGAVLDIGCGTGELLNTLSTLGFAPIIGTDASPTALNFAGQSSGQSCSLASSVAEYLPFADETFSLVTSLDVVEHLDDDVAALREYRRVTRPGGLIVIAVPAYHWAWSDHDVFLGHRRRYTASRLINAAENSGLKIDHVTYYHSWLVPLAFLMRKTPLGKLQQGNAEEASFVNPTINRLLTSLTTIERSLASRVRIPFGLSVLIVAHRAP